MSDERPQISILDARLAEIDERLSTIQTGLSADAGGGSGTDPGAGAEAERFPLASVTALALAPRVEVPDRGGEDPPPSAGPPARPVAAGAPSPGIAELRRIATAHEHLLTSVRELVSAYEHALGRIGALEATAAVQEFSVSAGPFTSTEALRGFERTLTQIPGVREVAVRGYEGGDRAIVDVQLHGPTS